MASALITLHRMVSPLLAFAAWLAPRPASGFVPMAAPIRVATPELRPACMRRTTRPLRVVRVMDRRHGTAARMLISGRMADVCAELDRLAALEAAGG